MNRRGNKCRSEWACVNVTVSELPKRRPGWRPGTQAFYTLGRERDSASASTPVPPSRALESPGLLSSRSVSSALSYLWHAALSPWAGPVGQGHSAQRTEMTAGTEGWQCLQEVYRRLYDNLACPPQPRVSSETHMAGGSWNHPAGAHRGRVLLGKGASRKEAPAKKSII